MIDKLLSFFDNDGGLQVFREGIAAQKDVAVGAFEIACVPRVGDVAPVVGTVVGQEVEQPMQLLGGSVAYQEFDVFDIAAVHTDNEVVLVVHLGSEALGRLQAAADAVGGQNALCKGVDRVADFLVGCSRRSNLHIVGKRGLVYESTKDKFGHRTATNIAVAYEYDAVFVRVIHISFHYYFLINK